MEASSALHSGAGSWLHQRKGQDQTVHRKGNDTRQRGERPDVGEGSRDRGRHSERSEADRRGMVRRPRRPPGALCTSAPGTPCTAVETPGGLSRPEPRVTDRGQGRPGRCLPKARVGSSVGPLRTQVLHVHTHHGPHLEGQLVDSPSRLRLAAEPVLRSRGSMLQHLENLLCVPRGL